MIISFLETLKSRNEALFYFGLVCLAASLFLGILTQTTTLKVYGINAYIKPLKFALSTFFLSWAMGWYIGYLKNFDATIFNYTLIITLSFEIIYIAIQASRGELSHYNLSTPTYAMLYSMMAMAASVATIAVGFVGLKFFGNEVMPLPTHYLWAIRLGIFIFVIFSFEGFVMGGRLTHTIGGADGGASLPFLNWSTQFGDPRVAHFIGMHALQVLPILSFYVFKNTKITLIVAILYAFLAIFTLVQALNARPFLRSNNFNNENIR